MSQFLEQPGLFDQPIRLGQEERRDPFGVMENFFDDYRLHEWRHNLWDMVAVCLTTDNAEFGEPDERGGLLQQYQDLEELLEAVWLVVQQRNGGKEEGTGKKAGRRSA